MRKSEVVAFAVMFLVMGMVLSVAAFGGTTGGNAPAVGKVNVPLTVPKPTKSECKNLTAGKAGIASFNVAGTTMVNWAAFVSDTNATGVTVKRKLNANTFYMPASSEMNLPISADVSTLVFGKFSSADNSVTPKVCVDVN